jgi:hypothetical protein
MASTITTKKLRVNVALRIYIHDPADATVAVVPAWVDMRDFQHFLATLTLVSGTGVLTFRLMASASADGSSPVEVKVHATPTVADAQGDQLVLECSADELNSLGTALRYVGAEVDMDVNSDIASLTYLRTEPRYASSTLLTDDVIA